MCGIAGKVTDGPPVERELVARMCDAILHRGPDSEGIHMDGPVGIGMRRLAIVDLVTGEQPLYSEDGQVVVVLNGEIYNHMEIRGELEARGHRLATHSDAEVVVHLWEEMGPRCVERLRGMFAFAVWDAREHELFLARDRLGKKPLFWCLRDGALRFASEPRAILQDPDVPRDVDPVALDAYLVNQYVPHDLCAFKALQKLPPACTLTWRPGGSPRVESYWRAEFTPKLDLADDEIKERLRELVLESTRMRLMSDVPIGAFLSGGVDSSAIVAAMAMSSSETVRTFSVKFSSAGRDETSYARMVAERYGTEHHELEVGPVDAGMLPRLAWHYGEPFADPAALPTLQLSELVRRHVKVALNGDGGDEAFAGYRRYWQLAWTRPSGILPRGVWGGAAAGLRRVAGTDLGRSLLPRAARFTRRLSLDPPARYVDSFRYASDRDRDALYSPAFRAALGDADPLAHVRRAWAGRPGLHWVDRALATDLDTYLPDDLLTKVDLASMARSLEVRSPLLDHEFVEFASRLPVSSKVRGRESKALFREALRPWLPDPVLDHLKRGFEAPVFHWLNDELRAVPREVLLDPVAEARGIFAPGAVRRLLDHQAATGEGASVVWALLNLELWFRTCVDRATARVDDLPVLV